MDRMAAILTLTVIILEFRIHLGLVILGLVINRMRMSRIKSRIDKKIKEIYSKMLKKKRSKNLIMMEKEKGKKMMKRMKMQMI